MIFNPRIFAPAAYLPVVLCFLFLSTTAHAHDPFDFSSRITLFNDHTEATVTMGLDGLRDVLKGAGLSDDEIARTIRSAGPRAFVDHPTTLADHFFSLKTNGQPITAERVTSLSEGLEVIFTLQYPRLAPGTLETHVMVYENVAKLRNGSLIIDDEAAKQLGAALLSRDHAQLTVSVPAPAPSPTVAPAEIPPALSREPAQTRTDKALIVTILVAISAHWAWTRLRT